MIQRSKRSLSLGRIEEMQQEVRAFEHKVRLWSAEVPIGSAVYIGLDPLNHSLGLLLRILSVEQDGKEFERRLGEGGIQWSQMRCSATDVYALNSTGTGADSRISFAA